MDDQDFPFPEQVADLQVVPACWRDLYDATDDGFELIPEAARQMREVEESWAAKLRDKDEQIAALDAKIETQQNELTDSIVGGAIHLALHERGVRPGLLRGAAALVRRSFKVSVIRNTAGEIETSIADSFGPVSVADAVSAWLGMEEAAPFLPPPPPSKGGALTAAVRRLSEGLH
ncbi:MAG: hypothetical protein E5V75_24020 [Mesorhizobium sp.]|nr:MAG: hypothetical protein E5V75_24020 [Mesorhizobium sp.]